MLTNLFTSLATAFVNNAAIVSPIVVTNYRNVPDHTITAAEFLSEVNLRKLASDGNVDALNSLFKMEMADLAFDHETGSPEEARAFKIGWAVSKGVTMAQACDFAES